MERATKPTFRGRSFTPACTAFLVLQVPHDDQAISILRVTRFPGLPAYVCCRPHWDAPEIQVVLGCPSESASRPGSFLYNSRGAHSAAMSVHWAVLDGGGPCSVLNLRPAYRCRPLHPSRQSYVAAAEIVRVTDSWDTASLGGQSYVHSTRGVGCLARLWHHLLAVRAVDGQPARW